MRRISLAVVLLSLCWSGDKCRGADDARPNFILFLVDDQDYESVAPLGGETYTPNLDRMAAEGMTFTCAHVSSTVCTPSRYSFLTGRYAGASTSALYNDACGGSDTQGFPSFNMALEPDRMNVGRVLSEAGYATGFVGKFHVESELDFPEFYASSEGFRAIPKKAQAGPETSALFAHNEQVLRRYLQNLGFTWAKHVYRGNLEPPYTQHNPEWTTAAALEFIEANQDRPFYLHCCSTLLHGPDGSWRRSMNYPLISGAGELVEPPQGMTPRQELLQQVAKHGFDPERAAAGEAWIDDALGAVLNKLKELGIDRNTLVVFAADHGSNSKASLFDRDGTRIPLFARWPARIPGGVKCDELVQNIDWVPTVFEAAGVEPPQEYRLDGRSLSPLFADGTAQPWRDHLYFELGYARAVEADGFKYIAVRYPQEQITAIRRASADRLPRLMSYLGRLGIGVRGADHPGFWDADQLYDLRHDSDEQHNLAADPRYAEQLATLRQQLTADVRSIGRPFGEFLPGGNAAPPGQIDEQIEQVKQLDPDDNDTDESARPRERKKKNRVRPRDTRTSNGK